MKDLEIQFLEIWEKRDRLNIIDALQALSIENRLDFSATVHSWNDWRAVMNFQAAKYQWDK